MLSVVETSQTSLITTFRAIFLEENQLTCSRIRFSRPNAKSRFLMPHKKAILWGPHFVLWSDLIRQCFNHNQQV